MFKLQVMFIFSFILFFTSCGKKSVESNSSLEQESLLGAWVSNCENNDESNSSAKRSLAFLQDSYLMIIKSYSNTNCLSYNLNFELSFYNNYTVEGNNIISSLTNYSVTPKSQAAEDGFNSNVLCGYNNWLIDVEKDVLGDNCGGMVTSYGTDTSFTATFDGDQLLMPSGNDYWTFSRL